LQKQSKHVVENICKSIFYQVHLLLHYTSVNGSLQKCKWVTLYFTTERQRRWFFDRSLLVVG